MPQSESRHPAAWLAVALFAGLPLAAAVAPTLDGAALAAPASAGSAADPSGASVTSGVALTPVESGRQVVFRGGGVLGVSCGASPDTTAVSVPAESTLRVVNRTGHRATLLLDGTARGEIAEGSTAEVLFRRGPVALKVKPHCVLAEESAAVRVRVQAHRTTPPPSAAPTLPPPAAPDPAPPAAPPVRPGTATPGGGAAPAPTAPDRRSTTPATAPGAAAPGVRSSAPAASPADGQPPSAAPDEEEPAGVELTEPAPGAPELAAEPMASVEPLSNRGPVGLLAAIATICVIGVSAGAIRAIVSQRARRTSLA